MRICTRFWIFLFATTLAMTTIGCQSSKGAYGNTKSHKKSSKKKKSTYKAPEKSTSDKPSESGDSGYKSNAQGNATGKKEEVKRLGYGCNLGALQFAGNQFQFGLSPNIAYKLSEPFAVGFMMKLDYYYFKDDFYGKYSSFGLGPTVFARLKPFWNSENATPFMQGIFVQAEYEHASISSPYDEFGNINPINGKLQAFRRWEDYLYVGIGTSTGFPSASFFSIHYNLLDDISHTRVPWNWRVGFTWNY